MISEVLSGKRDWFIARGDSLEILKQMPDRCVQVCITSPPYWALRDYGCEGQIGLEESLDGYVARLVDVFREVRRVLKDDGCLWLNLGDTFAGSGGAHTRDHANPGISRSSERDGVPHYRKDGGRGADKNGLPPKNILGVPWRVAFALQSDGWLWRQWCPWVKRNGMPDSAPDRPASACEVILFLAKGPDCYYDHEAVRKPRLSHENRPDGIVRDREYGYNSKLAVLKGRRAYSFARKTDENPAPGQPRQHRENREDRLYDNGRYRRNSDWFFESLQGMLTDGEGEPLAFAVNTYGFKGAHFATFPPALVEPMILASSRPGDVVLDPFSGSGTTVMVALRHGRRGLGLELNPAYVKMSVERIIEDNPLFNGFQMQS